METVAGLVLVVVAFGAICGLLVSYIWLIVEGFRTHPLWGIAVFCCYPWAAVVFVAMHWQRTRRPAILSLVGFTGMVIVAIGIPILQKAGLR